MLNILALTSNSGKIWNRKSHESKEGVFLKIDFSVSKPRTEAKLVSLLGDFMVAGDSKGNLFQFNFLSNSFSIFARGCTGCTMLSALNPSEVIVGLRSKNLEVYQTNGRLLSTLRGHKTPVRGVQSNTLKRMLLSYSQDSCILWNCDDWQKNRSLAIQHSNIANAAFSSRLQSVFTCFTDGHIFEWELNNYDLQRKMKIPEETQAGVCCTSNHWVVAAGKSGSLYVWTDESSSKPNFSVKLPARFQNIKKLSGYSNKEILLLTTNGRLGILNLESSKILLDIQEKAMILDFSGSDNLACVLSDGNVVVYDLKQLRSLKQYKKKPTVKEVEETPKLTHKTLKRMLDTYREYPEKHRVAIWKALLELPENKDAFAKLSTQQEHESLLHLRAKYPLKEEKLLKLLEQTMNGLAYWSPMLGEVDWVAPVVFPVVMMSRDPVFSFEFGLYFFLNWGQHWFENYPEPPVKLTVAVEQAIQAFDEDIVSHLHHIGAHSPVYVWPILKNLFTLVFTKEEWKQMMDFLVTDRSKPQFLVFLCAAFFVLYKPLIMGLNTKVDLDYFLGKQNPLNVEKMVRLAKEIEKKKTPLPVYEKRVPFTKYPVITNYPEFAVHYSAEVRKRVIQEETDLYQKNEHLKAITERLSTLEAQEKQFRKQQQALVDAEIERRRTQAIESAAKLEERQNMDRKLREQRLNQIKRIEGSIESSLRAQEELRHQEMAKLQEEMSLRAEEDRVYMHSKAEEESIGLLEFKATQRLLELMRQRSTEESLRRLRLDKESWEKEQAEKDRLLEHKWRIEDEERRMKLEIMREAKQKELLTLADMNDRKKLEMREQTELLEQELKMQEIERERRLRTLAEEEMSKNEEFLRQLTQQQEQLLQEEERQFQNLLQREKDKLQKRSEERTAALLAERAKQENEMAAQRREIQDFERQLEKQALNEKLKEIQHEEEMRGLQEDKQVQEMMLKIEAERRMQKQMKEDLDRRQQQLVGKISAQKALKQREDAAIAQKRSDFEHYRQTLQRQTEEIEIAQKKAHQIKMNAIIKQREDELQHLNERHSQNSSFKESLSKNESSSPSLQKQSPYSVAPKWNESYSESDPSHCSSCGYSEGSSRCSCESISEESNSILSDSEYSYRGSEISSSEERLPNRRSLDL